MSSFKSQDQFQGVFTALLTPFDSQMQIDWESYEKLLKIQVAAGVSGVIPCGTTGESPTLSTDEKKQLILKALEICKGTSTQVIAGTGSNNTLETCALSQWASEQGVDALLVVTPYYNKPSQKGLIAHYLSVANSVQCPIILYNVPGRTGVQLTPKTVAELSRHPRIRAIKESSGNLSLISEIFSACQEQGSEITVLSGDDPLYLSGLAQGATGLVSVASNLIPNELLEITRFWKKGSIQESQDLFQKISPFLRALFMESNPVPAKCVAYLQGRMQNVLRLPLVPAEPSTQEEIKKCLAQIASK